MDNTSTMAELCTEELLLRAKLFRIKAAILEKRAASTAEPLWGNIHGDLTAQQILCPECNLAALDTDGCCPRCGTRPPATE